MPWANGLGSTVEIASDVESLDAPWTWRLSIADLPSRAEFSRFPSFDRWIACLDGSGMRVERGGVWSDVPPDGESLPFAGEESVIGEPLGAGVRDVNWFLLRDRWRGGMRVLRSGRCADVEGEIVLVHAAVGIGHKVTCEGHAIDLDEGCTLLAIGRVEVERCSHGTLVLAWATNRIES